MPSAPVLILPIIDWEFRTQRPQQLARCFARAGARVYYPDLRLHPEPEPPRLVEAGLWRIALAGDSGLDPYRDRLGAGDVEQAMVGLAALTEDHPLEGCWVVAHLPYWRPLAEAVREHFGGYLLFDCMDDFGSFGDHADPSHEEEALAAGADLVTVTSDALHDKLAPLAKRLVLIRNGCDPEHFGPAAARAPVRAGPPILGFFGGIHDWFDASLVAELARRRPEWQVWLVGDTYRGDVEALRRLPNVVFFGEVPYPQLPRVVSSFSVGIIPFKVGPLTVATNPVKVYEMLAAGLPVVAVDLPEIARLAPMVATARSVEEFVERVAEALATDSTAARGQRRLFARAHSWVERFVELREAMTQVEEAGGRSKQAAAFQAPHGPRDLAVSDELERIGQSLLRDAAALREERDAWCARAADLDRERVSLVEQRDRVQAEAERLLAELERVESERLDLERRVREVTASRLWRAGERLRRLREPG